VLAFNAACTTTAFWVPNVCVRTSVAAVNVIVLTLAKELTELDTLPLVVVPFETDELASPQATKVSVKTEVVTNLKIFFIIKNHLLKVLYIK
jgi:hypothetical protein